jgi:N-acyl-D-amino-acid deacylase
VDELIRISREAKIPAEIYHIKAAGKSNWPKLEQMLAKIENAQKEGLRISADMYVYPAAGTGLDACLPPWTADGGYPALFQRLRDPAMRKKIAAEMRTASDAWENFYLGAGSPDRIILSGFQIRKTQAPYR